MPSTDIQKQIDDALRVAIPGQLRVVAETHAALGDLHERMAASLRAEADGIENGTRKIRSRVELREASAEDDQTQLTGIGVDDGHAFTAPDGQPLSTAMESWLEGFDQRWLSSPHFLPVVNGLAEQGAMLTERGSTVLAMEVITRIREREGQAAASGEAPRG